MPNTTSRILTCDEVEEDESSSPSWGGAARVKLASYGDISLDKCTQHVSSSNESEIARRDSYVNDVSKREHLPLNETYEVASKNQRRCHIYNLQMYNEMYQRSIGNSDNFWRDMAMANLRWIRPFNKVHQSNMEIGEVAWFLNGKLNVCDNCVDRWAEQYPSRTAIIWEGDDPAVNEKHISYQQLKVEVCKFANLLIRLGVRRRDTVALYMPMCPKLVYAMLACARIGAIHCVIFAGFSAPNLKERLIEINCELLITADQGIRGGREIPLKKIADEALRDLPQVKTCLVFKRLGKPITWVEGRDIAGDDMLLGMRPYCPCAEMDSEDLLFILQTSGSTGRPKGVAHSSAGYLLHAALSHKYIFDYHPGDVYACVADMGWITGHSYVVYGPLCNGATTVLFESIPTYPDPGRYWDMVQKHGINSLYTAPTAIRTLMRFGDQLPKKYNLTSLRILGSVGEPINPEAWKWYFNVIGNGECNIVDTYWQTETGGIMLSPFPGATKTKPGCATVPFFGVDPALIDPHTGLELEGNDVAGLLVIKRDWPGMMRTIYGNHKRIFKTYLSPYPGYYFTGDGAYRDKDGYYWITGRVDDTLNIAGHRLGSAEVESALLHHPDVAESAVVPYPHKIKGNGIFCFVTLKKSATITDEIDAELKSVVRQNIGPVATPDVILLTDVLPKTASGKILRRHLRRIAAQEFDLSESRDNIVHPECIDRLVKAVAEKSFPNSP